jgi:hypothetical protein
MWSVLGFFLGDEGEADFVSDCSTELISIVNDDDIRYYGSTEPVWLLT